MSVTTFTINPTTKLAAFLFAALCSFSASSQDPQATTRQWAFDADLNFYFFQSDFFVLPVVRADHKKLHLEGRYNYEDRNTFSMWAGYNFEGGTKLHYVITPMASIVFGQTDGVATGMVFDLTYKRLELRNEAEFLFDSESADNNFFYNWADFTYSANDWFSFGISGQRTKLYQTALDFQRGVLVSFAGKRLEATTYLYNLGFDTPFLLVTLSAEF
jgi:hypothetical protein